MELEHRVIKLELQTENHAEELKELRTTSKALSSSLSGIEKALQQIKWLAMGGASVVFARELGAEKLFKIIFGI